MLFLSDPLPLRQASALGSFSATEYLAHRIGDLSNSPFKLLQLSPTEFHVADHPMTVTGVQIDEQPSSAFDVSTRTDGGVTSTIVRLSVPLPAGATITATGKGRLGSDGALIEAPSKVVSYLLGLAGRTLSPTVLAALHAQTAGIKLAGSIDDPKTIRAWLDELATSTGAVWTAGLFTLYPIPAPAPRIVLSTRNSVFISEPVAQAQYVAGRIRLSYAHNASKDRYDGVVELAAAGTPFTNLVEVNAGWIRQEADAEALASRLLARMAAAPTPVQISATVPSPASGGLASIAPGQWVQIARPELNKPAFVLGREYIAGGPSAVLSCEVTVLDPPTITLVSHSIALPPTIRGRLEAQLDKNQLKLTIIGPDGKPAPGARVSLNNSIAKIADAQGKVVFIARHGTHRVSWEIAGQTPMSMEVVL